MVMVFLSTQKISSYDFVNVENMSELSVETKEKKVEKKKSKFRRIHIIMTV